MKEALARLAEDFFSTLVFLAVYFASGEVLVATAVALAGALGQLLYARVRRRRLNFMAYASLGLVAVLGGLTLVTHDPRFVLAKPSIAHFAIGTIMLKRGWMLRYVPKAISERAPRLVTVSGYAWAGLMFALGIGTVVFAWIGDVRLWALYVSVVALGVKIIALALQYLVFWALAPGSLPLLTAVEGAALHPQGRHGHAEAHERGPEKSDDLLRAVSASSG